MPSTQSYSSTKNKGAVGYSEHDQILMENDYDQMYSEQNEIYNHGHKGTKSKYEDHAHPDGALKYGNGLNTYGSTDSEYHKDNRIKIDAQDAYVHGMSHEHMDSHVHGMSHEHMDSQYHNQGDYQSSNGNTYGSSSVSSNNYATIEDEDDSHDRNDVAVTFGNGPSIHEATNSEYHHTSNYNDYGGKYGNDKLSEGGNQNLAISNQHSTAKLSADSKGSIASNKVHIEKISSGISYVPVEHVADVSYQSSVALNAGGVLPYATNPSGRSALSVSKKQANYDTQSDYYNELNM